MCKDWIEVCNLAGVFHVEEWGKELWLVKHATELIDGPVEFPVGSGNITNIPFRPHILAAKADKKEAAKVFPYWAKRWLD